MKNCGNCGKKKSCGEICPDIERRLPKDDTGKNAHLEVNIEPDRLGEMAESRSFTDWRHCEIIFSYPKLDLSKLTKKEKNALMMMAAGVSQREAAKRLKISRISLRDRMDAIRRKLLPAQKSHLIERETTPGGGR
ncbi:MAG: LuxR C-terminal-related transcriptional regulator [Nitrospirota bacterium]